MTLFCAAGKKERGCKADFAPRDERFDRICFNTVQRQEMLSAPQALYREKLVATVSRRECVYKRAGEGSVTFHERGGARERADDALLCRRQKRTSEQSGLCSDVVEVTGLEPAASASRTQRSTKLSHTSPYSLVFCPTHFIITKEKDKVNEKCGFLWQKKERIALLFLTFRVGYDIMDSTGHTERWSSWFMAPVLKTGDA